MKKVLFIIAFLFTTYISYAQDSSILGVWKYEKMVSEEEMDEKGVEMANMMFGDMTLAFDKENYSFQSMGKVETGTWTDNGNNIYALNSSKGYSQDVELKPISENQLIFNMQGKGWQLTKTSNIAHIELEVRNINKIEGVKVNEKDLLGTWVYDGQIKNGKESGIILKHEGDELVSYTFQKDGTFINKAPLGVVLEAKWSLDTDEQTLVIESEELTEYLKVVKMTVTDLHLFNPKVDAVIKFVR